MGISLAEIGGAIRRGADRVAKTTQYDPFTDPALVESIDPLEAERAAAAKDRDRAQRAPHSHRGSFLETDSAEMALRSIAANPHPATAFESVVAALGRYEGESHTHVLAADTGIPPDTIASYVKILPGWGLEYEQMDVGGVLTAAALGPQESQPLPTNGASVVLLDNGPAHPPPPPLK